MDRQSELRAFLAVVDTGGFSAAARRIGQSQPVVSKAVGSLEQRLGVKLLHRSTRHVTLTDQGKKYYDRTRPLLEEMDDIEAELSGSTRHISGLVRVAVSATFGRLHVLPLIPELLSRYPGLQVDLTLSDAVRDMVEDRIDLAIRIAPVIDADAVVRRVASTPLVCVGSRRYFERHGPPLTPADLTRHNCLLFTGRAEPSKWPFAGPNGPFSVAVSGNVSSNSVETIRAGVLDGLGLGLIAELTLTDALRTGEAVSVLGDFLTEVRDVSLVWPHRRFIPERVRRVTEFFATSLPRAIQRPGLAPLAG